MGFRIPKLCQILKRFSRTIHHSQTSYYFIRVSRYVKKPTSKYITKFDTTLQWLPTFKTTRKLPQNYAFATTYCFYHQPSLWWTFQKDLFSSSFLYTRKLWYQMKKSSQRRKKNDSLLQNKIHTIYRFTTFLQLQKVVWRIFL